MCEAFTPREELALSDATHQCVGFSGVKDINEVYQTKINSLIEEDVLEEIENEV